MLAKDLFSITPGTFLKSFRVVKESHLGRRATLLMEPNWELVNLEPFDCIRTPFYTGSDIHLKCYDSSDALKNIEKLQDSGEDLSKIPQDDWVNLESPFDFKTFKPNNPIGIHLGRFAIGLEGYWKPGSEGSGYYLEYNVYTQILCCDGDVGYLAFHTEDLLRKELILL